MPESGADHRATARRRVPLPLVSALVGALAVTSLPSVASATPGAPVAPTTVAPTTTPTPAPTTTPTTVVPATTQPAAAPTATTTTTTTTTTPPVATTPTVLVPPPSATVPAVTTTTTPPVPTPPTTAAPGPAAPTARNITVYPEQMQYILATIRYLESRGIYTIPPNRGNASGAYQFIGSTWNNYGGYAHAYLAPPHIQDERAASDVNKFLAQFDNDVSMIPVMWYLPAAARNPALMDVVPLPSAGNVLTIREYQTRWLGVFASISGKPIQLPQTGPVDLSALAGFAPEVPLSSIESPAISYPVLGPSRVAIPECDDAVQIEVADNDSGADSAATDGPSRADNEAAGLCTPQAPGIVFGVKLQPVLVVADGVVTDVRNVDGSAITVTVTDPNGTSYVYSGFNDDNPGTADGQAPDHLRLSALAAIGREVRAGQVIGFMGDTDPLPIGVRADVPTDATIEIDPDAVAPHIRITMVDIAGNPIDAFGPMIDALFRQTCRVMIGQWSIPANGSDHEPVTIETTDDDDEIDSEWVITADGRVTASGWGALVNPSESCGYAPNVAFGPGAGGADMGLVHWLDPIVLPTDVWIVLALQDEHTIPGLVSR